MKTALVTVIRTLMGYIKILQLWTHYVVINIYHKNKVILKGMKAEMQKLLHNKYKLFIKVLLKHWFV